MIHATLNNIYSYLQHFWGGIKITALLQVGINVGVNQKQLTSIKL